MLQPNKDRLDYGTLLMPPEGYVLDNALATTYSLDLDALISIPVALYFAHSLDLDVKQDVVQVLDSIRRASSTVKVFCQKGQIKVPENQHRLYSFIEPCVVQIPPTHRDSFHPKIWVIRFKSDDKKIKYRVIILSRNLTFDRSWDVAFQLEGDCFPERTNNFSETKPLVDFINYLGEYEKVSWFKQFLYDLGKTKFELTTNEFESFTFLPTGIAGYKKNIIFDDFLYDEILIVSPFLTKDGLELAKEHSATKIKLFSRETELKKINKELLNKFEVWHLNNEYVLGEEKIEVDTIENSIVQNQDLHAKIYCYKEKSNAYLVLGSSNCSQRAMLRNVEFMINLKGKNSKIGPDVLFKELVNDDLSVFQKFNHSEQLSESETLQLEQEQILQYLKISLVNSTLKAKALMQEDSNYKIEINYDLKDIPKNPKIQATGYLFRTEEQKQVLHFGTKNSWLVHNIAELDLSSFFILELQLIGTEIRLKFALKILIDDLPKTRSTKIFRDIISNTANFFKYVRFLLADNFWDEQLSFKEMDNKNAVVPSELGAYFTEEPIYENMLKAISREPEKLMEIKTVIEKISEEEDPKSPIIPKDFKDLWNVFNEAYKSKNDK